VPLIDIAKLYNGAGIYIIRNTVNSKEYIGQSLNVKVRLMGHLRSTLDRVLYRAFTKYGLANFTVSVIPVEASELNKVEIQLIEARATLVPNGYNATSGGEGTTGWVPSTEFREAVSARRKGTTTSEEVRSKISKALLGHTLSVESRSKLSNSRRGLKMSEDFCNRMSENFANDPKRVAQCRKLAQAKLGTKASISTREKMSHGEVLLWESEAMLPKVFISTAELAAYLELNPATVSRWVRGQRNRLGIVATRR
jgi:group I intron endonuclease